MEENGSLIQAKGQPGRCDGVLPTTGRPRSFPDIRITCRNCANLLRNFFTRPPSVVHRLWVPV